MTEGIPRYPMLLEPLLVEKPWGGRGLEQVFGRRIPAGKVIGESWEVYDRPGRASRIRNGPLEGRTVAEVRGTRPLPFMVKVLDVQDRLSLQVHPDAGAAVELGGEPKSEAWFVIGAGPRSRLWMGLREWVSREGLLEALRGGRAEEVVREYTPAAGEAYYLPAGTVHSAGGGVLLAEVQENSDTTYRLLDWGLATAGAGGRDLHLPEGLASLRARTPEAGPVGSDAGAGEGGSPRRTVLRRSPFLIESVVAMDTEDLVPTPGARPGWTAVLLLSGWGTVSLDDGCGVAAAVGPGETVLLPEGEGRFRLAPKEGLAVRALVFREC